MDASFSRQGTNMSDRIQSHQGIRYISCYFKVARTSFSKIYNIPIDWKMCDFINNIKQYCNQDFPGDVLTPNIEVVCVGQYAEDGVALDQNETQTFYDKYISRNLFPAFYIRNINSETDDARNERERTREAEREAQREAERQENVSLCVICLEENIPLLQLICRHHLCVACFNTYLSYGRHSCPCCRRNTVYRDLLH